MNSINTAIGRSICELRKESGLSQEELAQRAGVHRTYVSQLERGVKSPTVAVLAKIATALDTVPSQILKRIEDRVE